ncbi:MAG: glycosyl hydrolase family 18 protein [Sphingobacteriaceae bacterium]
MKKLIYIIVLFPLLSVFAQKPVKSIMQEQKEFYDQLIGKSKLDYDSVQLALGNRKEITNLRSQVSNTCTLTKKVFGWHPYWIGTAYNNYQWNLLSDLCYFDYSINPATGSNTNTAFAWSTASVVTVAKNNGTKIHICATLFSSHASFWASTTSQNNFINNIISLLNTRQGNGVNIDFEGMGGSDKVPFTNFITNLNTALNAANPNYQLSVCLYAVDWGAVFDMPALNSQVDFFTIMGYDYYYSASAQAGPTAPLYNFQTTYNYTLPKSISYYMKQGASANKLVMGLPYYGREWEVSSTTVPANTTNGFNSSRTLSYINNNPATYSSSVKYWENNCYSPYYKFVVGSSNRQCFIDDVYSLGRKYDMVNQRGLAGIGIWALGYDDGMTSYWNLIKDKFSDCAPLVCNDSIFDMGGPTRNYYDNEKYDFVLNAGVGQKVKLQFVSFGTELNYDTLWLYNGTSTLSPLMGSYTGTNSPGTVTSSGQYLTLRYKTDGNTVSFGYKAYKSCYTPTVATNLAENRMNDDVMIWPNPASDKVFIRSTVTVQEIRLFDANGKCIKEQLIEKKDQNEIDLSELSRGIYFLETKDKLGHRETKKILIQ